MITGRLLLTLLGLIIAYVFFTESMAYPAAAARMPMIYAVVVALLSGLMGIEAAMAIRKRRARRIASTLTMDDATPRPANEPGDEPAPTSRAGTIKLIGMVIFTLAYVLLLFPLGYVIATLAFLAVSLLWLRHVSISMAVIGTLVLVASVCVIFIWFLRLPIPLMPSLSGI